MTMKLKKDKVYKASYLKELQQPNAMWFYDDWFAKVAWINAPQLEQTISIQL